MRQSYNRRHDPPVAGRGIVRCAGCGGPMRPGLKPDGRLYYECAWRYMGKGCTARAYLAELGDGAILAQVCRLRGAPWTPQAERRLSGGEHATHAAELGRTLDAERERLRRHTRALSLVGHDPTPEEIVAFREVSAEISARIRALEAQVTDLGQRAARAPALRALHARLTRTEIPALVALLRERGDLEGLRELAQGLVTAARIVERRPESHPKWLRAEVTWHPDIPTLLEAGLLRLDTGPAPPPPGPSKQEMLREYCRRYRERHREERNARRREQRAAARERRREWEGSAG
jgi:hypothetical protein